MKHLILVFIIIGTVLVFWGCQGNSALAPVANQSDQGSDFLTLAKKPAPNLTGTMELDYTFGDWPEEPVWVGTISFEGYDEYGIRFYHLSDFRDYSQASPFEEYFEIYNLSDGTVCMGGPDVGVTTTANKPPDPCKYRMNGEIDLANEPFEEWLGRNVHMSGVITWQILETPGWTSRSARNCSWYISNKLITITGLEYLFGMSIKNYKRMVAEKYEKWSLLLPVGGRRP